MDRRQALKTGVALAALPALSVLGKEEALYDYDLSPQPLDFVDSVTTYSGDTIHYNPNTIYFRSGETYYEDGSGIFRDSNGKAGINFKLQEEFS